MDKKFKKHIEREKSSPLLPILIISYSRKSCEIVFINRRTQAKTYHLMEYEFQDAYGQNCLKATIVARAFLKFLSFVVRF